MPSEARDDDQDVRREIDAFSFHTDNYMHSPWFTKEKKKEQ
jgi:hypothetical protein